MPGSREPPLTKPRIPTIRIKMTTTVRSRSPAGLGGDQRRFLRRHQAQENFGYFAPRGVHLKKTVASTAPITVQITNTAAVIPNSNDPATSMAAAVSGRNTLRMACVSHFSGNNDANVCIHCGRSLKTKKTPEVNCSTRTTGETRAAAPLPCLGTT